MGFGVTVVVFEGAMEEGDGVVRAIVLEVAECLEPEGGRGIRGEREGTVSVVLSLLSLTDAEEGKAEIDVNREGSGTVTKGDFIMADSFMVALQSTVGVSEIVVDGGRTGLARECFVIQVERLDFLTEVRTEGGEIIPRRSFARIGGGSSAEETCSFFISFQGGQHVAKIVKSSVVVRLKFQGGAILFDRVFIPACAHVSDAEIVVDEGRGATDFERVFVKEDAVLPVAKLITSA